MGGWEKTTDANDHFDYRPWSLQSSAGDVMKPLLRDAWIADIVTVISTGNKPENNQGPFFMGEVSPQRFANSQNALIAVASANELGQPDWGNLPIGTARDSPDQHLAGEHTIYANGVRVPVPLHGTQNGFENKRGSSFAAPQVAGLAAYFLSLPLQPPAPGTVALSIKRKLLQLADPSGTRSPAVAYNHVWEDCTPNGGNGKRSWHTSLGFLRRSLWQRASTASNIKAKTVYKNGKVLDQRIAKYVSAALHTLTILQLTPLLSSSYF